MRNPVAVLTAVVVALGLAIPGQAGAKDLTYGNYLPPKHNSNVYALAPYFKAVNKEVTGENKWRLLTGGQLFSGRATLESVGGGIADAGMIVPSYTQKELKHAFVLSDLMMFGFEDPLAANGAMLETFFFECPECQQDYKKNNTIYLVGYSTSDYAIMCNKKVESLADMKGKKIRTTGAMGRWAKAMGGTPISMTSGEMVEGIQRGQLDCIMGPIGWMESFPGVAESVKYIIDFPMGVYVGFGVVVMNLDAWKRLSPSDKAAMIRNAPGASARVMIDGYLNDNNKARSSAASKGIVRVTGGPDFDARMKMHRTNEEKSVAAKAKARGVKNPERIIKAYFKNLDKWMKIMAGQPRTTAAYQKILWDNVFSKIDPSKL